MEYISTQKFIRMSPKKIRVVAQVIRKLTPEKAVEVLPYIGKRAGEPLEKTIKSAIANARMQGAEVGKLEFKEIQIGEGPRLKRAIAVSRGRSHPIVKKMAHIRIVLQTKTEAKVEKTKEKTAKIEEKTVTKKGAKKSGTKS